MPSYWSIWHIFSENFDPKCRVTKLWRHISGHVRTKSADFAIYRICHLGELHCFLERFFFPKIPIPLPPCHWADKQSRILQLAGRWSTLQVLLEGISFLHTSIMVSLGGGIACALEHVRCYRRQPIKSVSTFLFTFHIAFLFTFLLHSHFYWHTTIKVGEKSQKSRSLECKFSSVGHPYNQFIVCSVRKGPLFAHPTGPEPSRHVFPPYRDRCRRNWRRLSCTWRFPAAPVRPLHQWCRLYVWR